MRSLVLALAITLVVTSVSAPAGAQRADESRVSTALIERARRADPERRSDDMLITAGVLLILGGWLGGAATNALASFAYFESRPPCIPGFCGHEALFSASLIPLAGSAIWSVMVLDTPPVPSGPALSISGFLFTALQQAGICALIAGIVGRPMPWVAAPVATHDGLRVQVAGTF